MYFPDYHRAEWLNKMVHHLWPHLQDYLRQRLDFDLLLGVLKLSTKIGGVPPRIGGVKVATVYRNVVKSVFRLNAADLLSIEV